MRKCSKHLFLLLSPAGRKASILSVSLVVLLIALPGFTEYQEPNSSLSEIYNQDLGIEQVSFVQENCFYFCSNGGGIAGDCASSQDWQAAEVYCSGRGGYVKYCDCPD